MANRRLATSLFLLGFAFLSLITAIIVQAQSDDNPPPPDGPAVIPDESSAIDWSQIALPAHEEPAPAAPSIVPAPDTTGELTAVPPQSANQNSYVVQPGDTLFNIARRFGVSVTDLTAVNHITNPSRIYVGQILSLSTNDTAVPLPVISDAPPAETGTYTVQRGDTLSAIARKFGVEVMSLAAVNNIINPSLIRVGQTLSIPGATAVTTPVNPQPQPQPTPAKPAPADSSTYIVQSGDTLYLIARKFGIPIQTLTAVNQISNPSLIYPGQKLLITTQVNESAPSPVEPAPQATFIWPVKGWIVKQYAYGHQAIDIAVPVGTAVQAMAAGKIEYAGWNDYGYGNLVVVDHGNGWRTLYAHNSSFQVKTGDAVGQGDTIALSGSTGNSSMPHVHLEMMLNLGYANPCNYLPGGC